MSHDTPRRPDRREFIRTTGAAFVSLPVLSRSVAGAEKEDAVAVEPNHLIPPDKNLPADWLQKLVEKGTQDVLQGERLKTVGMPVGGIAAGQIYLRGDGTLALWDIFSEIRFSGYGKDNYGTYTPPAPVNSGFVVWVKRPETAPRLRTLDSIGYPNVQFVGQYPLAQVRYPDDPADPLGVNVTLEAFSPFIPLNAKDSALPATVMRFTVTNTTAAPLAASLAGWLQNAVLKEQGGKIRAASVNRSFAGDGIKGIELGVIETPAPLPPRPPGKPDLFADFESGTYEGWTADGKAFGDKPATGKIGGQQPVSGWQGKRFINTFNPNDEPVGTLTSKEFVITRPYINFRVGGGNHQGKTCVSLLVDGRVVRTAVGRNTEQLEWRSWDVIELTGRRARIQAVDAASEGWGHILLDDIQFADTPADGTVRLPHELTGFGSMALTVVDPAAGVLPEWEHRADFFNVFNQDGRLDVQTPCQPYPLGLAWSGSVASRFDLPPGASRTVTFLITWFFPNHVHTRMYANWFQSAPDVARYVAANIDRLYGHTKLYHDTYYDSTLPHWLLDRLHAPVANLATNTCEWWKNGRFWAWEGVGCCHGTCAHVWNYEHALARLFPELERSVREMQDLGVALNKETGLVGFRGAAEYAADGQAGTILKCYREHLTSADDAFLKRNWDNIKKALGYALRQDADDDGLIENSQHNTFDINFEGPNTFVGSLYLGALRAGEEMARRVGDHPFADRCRKVFAAGRDLTMKRLWNGEYFFEEVDLTKHPRHQYGTGCLSDQLFGQGWAHQVALGYLYPRDAVITALRSVYKYNWAPDVSAPNKAYPPDRVFASPGEAGLLTCTWPKGYRPREPVLYKDEVWTGIEYQVAGHMIWEGMVTEALTLIRAIHERYDGAKHNPWNEIECGDHYARALASWGCLTALEGYEYDGPAGRIGFAPRLTPENFKALFTAAEGWGTLAQQRRDKHQLQTVSVKWGSLAVQELVFDLPDGATLARAVVKAAGRPVDAQTKQSYNRITLRLAERVTVPAGAELSVEMTCA